MVDVYVDNIPGDKIVFQFSDGASPPVFTPSCSINTSRKLTLGTEVKTGKSPNCTAPSKPAKTTNRVDSQSIRFAGSGYADAASYKALVQKWQAGLPFDGIASITTAVNPMDIDGSWIIESLEIGGEAREDGTFDISMVNADSNYSISFP